MRLPQIIGGILIASIVGFGGWMIYDVNQGLRTEEKLRHELARMMEEMPTARIRCDAIEKDPAGGPDIMRIRWAPVGENGKLLDGTAPRTFTLKGDVAYFDAYQIIFDDQLVREGDPFRGRTLTLFARAFGDAQAPRDGEPLDVPKALAAGGEGGTGHDLVPAPFRQAKDSRAAMIERRLWSRFWDLCMDPEFAQSEGVRTAQGTAASMPMVPGREYTVTVRRSGQVLIKAEEKPLFTEQ